MELTVPRKMAGCVSGAGYTWYRNSVAMAKLAPAPRIAKKRSLLGWVLSTVTGSCSYLQ